MNMGSGIGNRYPNHTEKARNDMSKYIKLDETVNALIELGAKLGSQRQAKRGVRLAIGYVNDLPTIEVGDDCVSMTKEEALEIRDTIEETIKILDTIPTIGEQVDALEMAIKALEQELSEDCISRRAAIEAICKDGTMFERQGQYSMTMAERKQRDIDILEALPSPYKGGDTE